MWNDDSIEWFIDTLNDGGGSTDPNSAYMLTDDYHGIVSLLNTQYDASGSSSGAPSGSWNGNWQASVRINGTNNNNTDTDSGYSLEVKIPWSSIGYSSPPSEDSIVGMSFAVNDKDASGLTSLMWPDITTAYQNASKWQPVQLSAKSITLDTITLQPPTLHPI